MVTITCAVFVFGSVKLLAQFDPLDDTAAFIHLAPNPVSGFTCEEFAVNIQLTATDARVFELRFVFDAADYQLVAVTPGSLAALHVLPHMVDADTIWLDGYFHPNFTGLTTIATLHFIALAPLGDHSTLIGLLDGQGWSGTADAPEPMLIGGDSTTVNLEGTPPLPPETLVIKNFLDDSVRLTWHKVTLDEDSDPVVSPWYIVEFEDILNNEGVYTPIGNTQDTFFYHDFIIYDFDPGDTSTVNAATYRIRATKCEP
ncbi:MAG: hypothetical protein IPG71_01750 [bacterium]|nr:hypothetical protein [bacterium]